MLSALCFSAPGRAPPRNAMVDLNSGNIDVPPNMTNWPSFHNGVAAGLKIAPASQVSSKLQALCLLSCEHVFFKSLVRTTSKSFALLPYLESLSLGSRNMAAHKT